MLKEVELEGQDPEELLGMRDEGELAAAVAHRNAPVAVEAAG